MVSKATIPWTRPWARQHGHILGNKATIASTRPQPRQQGHNPVNTITISSTKPHSPTRTQPPCLCYPHPVFGSLPPNRQASFYKSWLNPFAKVEPFCVQRLARSEILTKNIQKFMMNSQRVTIVESAVENEQMKWILRALRHKNNQRKSNLVQWTNISKAPRSTNELNVIYQSMS